MNRMQLNEFVTKRLDVTQREGREAVTAVLDGILHGAWTDGKVVITSFGIFEIVRMQKRNARNPQTGEVVVVPARKVFRFHSPKTGRVNQELKAGKRPKSSLKRRKGTLQHDK